ncbi:MAG: glycolate oxidase subunit GlcE [Betaproteobacteria bacterium]|nr:glycolate oxidase subunit GlcE [Betaproteobacteria bacterium]
MQSFVEQIHAATSERPLRLRGGGGKDFYGNHVNTGHGEILDTREYSGIVAYEPTELVITARCGTPLTEIEAALAGQDQMLAFEPPHFSAAATIGGCVASGLSGPRRAAVGAVRDFVLGVKMLDGAGTSLTFGGQVMKNVAGYDVARLMTGSLGTLGLLLEVSLKVLPLPVAEATLRLEAPQDKALELMNRWAGQPLPVSATCWQDDLLTLRLSGARSAVVAAQQRIGGELVNDANFWRDLREQKSDFFTNDLSHLSHLSLWRLSLPSVAPPLNLPGAQLIEWGGSLRWLRSGADAAGIRTAAAQAGGHATLFRGSAEQKSAAGVFQPLPAALLTLHRKLKQSFDPKGIFNPGRMYREM